ncbi:hypothetical protein CTI12_AA137140 [Artemisia annua]|uniref:Uncharacterized protein n=1 Tax=Artemisia annua TaxID=35608 RepID=A0A2U1PLX6_ARTAN|nr:hypothetical protein CTI12_AA137140 [Artemisia annua]
MVRTKMNAAPRNDGRGDVEPSEGNLSIFTSDGQSSGQGISRRLSDKEYIAARIYVILNCVKIEEYAEIFVEEIKANDPTITDDQVDRRLENEFADWFNHHAHDSRNVDNQIIMDVTLGPLRRSVTSYPMYFVNGYTFHTSEHGSWRSTFNIGVCIKENTVLQDDEVEEHSIDAADLSTIHLNDSSGIRVDMDDGDDDLQHSGDDND